MPVGVRCTRHVAYADDVGLGLVCTAIVIGMAYVVHSFRVEANRVEAD